MAPRCHLSPATGITADVPQLWTLSHPAGTARCDADRGEPGMAGAQQWRPAWHSTAPTHPHLQEQHVCQVCYSLQMGPVRQSQCRCREQYVACALSKGMTEAADQPSPQAIYSGTAALESKMAWLWHVIWENAPKETLWRLTLNGVPGTGGHDVADKRPCACGWQPSQDGSPLARAHAWRTHCFWDCTVATAVVGELAKCLPGARITCADVWLLQPPAGAHVNSKVWAFVVMVALHAMAHGRRVMWARWQAEIGPANQTLITDFFPVVSDRCQSDGVDGAKSHAAYAARNAVVWFWCLLQDFVRLKVVPGEWLGVVPPDHPFIGVLGIDEGMCLNLPLELRLPDDLL